MTGQSPEPTPEQVQAARNLYDSGTQARNAEIAWAEAVQHLDQAVKGAKDAGIPRNDIPGLIAGARELSTPVRAAFLKSRRQHYDD